MNETIDNALKAGKRYRSIIAAHPNATNVKVPPAEFLAILELAEKHLNAKGIETSDRPKPVSEMLEDATTMLAGAHGNLINLLVTMATQVKWLSDEVNALRKPPAPAPTETHEEGTVTP